MNLIYPRHLKVSNYETTSLIQYLKASQKLKSRGISSVNMKCKHWGSYSDVATTKYCKWNKWNKSNFIRVVGNDI